MTRKSLFSTTEHKEPLFAGQKEGLGLDKKK